MRASRGPSLTLLAPEGMVCVPSGASSGSADLPLFEERSSLTIAFPWVPSPAAGFETSCLVSFQRSVQEQGFSCRMARQVSFGLSDIPEKMVSGGPGGPYLGHLFKMAFFSFVVPPRP